MLCFRPGQVDGTLYPLLFESLIADPLWSIVCMVGDHDGISLPLFDYVSCDVFDQTGEPRNVVPIFSKWEFADEFRHGFSGPQLEKSQCLMTGSGRYLLAALAERNVNIAIDSGHQGLVMDEAYWRPIYERYRRGQGQVVTLLTAASRNWGIADPDDFPVWRDRVTCLLRCLGYVGMAWLLWVPKSVDRPLQLCLATAEFFTPDLGNRVCEALPLLADGLDLPPLAYLPLAYADSNLMLLPDQALFYSDELGHALDFSSDRYSSR